MLDFDAQLGARGFDVSLSVAAGETLAILGPNGAGKSTLLALVAGLLKADGGSARLDDKTLFDARPGSAHVYVPPHARAVSLLAQQPLLFPHLSVVDNVAFGPRSAGIGKRRARSSAAHWLDAVDAGEFAQRRPAQLSGGQAQRIAVARALASEPKLLLLDEPLAALDVTVAPALRRTLAEVLADKTAIIVTHDVLDAYTLADVVAVMNEGSIVEMGPTREVFHRPRTPFTAALVALNLVQGIRSTTGMTSAGGLEIVGPLLPGENISTGAELVAIVPPGAIDLAADDPEHTSGGRPNAFRLVVTDLEPRGDVVRVGLGEIFADVPPAEIARLDLAPGVRVRAEFEPSVVRIYRP